MENNQQVSVSNKNKKVVVIGVFIAVVVAVGAYMFMRKSNNEVQPTPTETPSVSVEASPTPTEVVVKSFTVSAKNYSFSLPEIKVKVGDKIKIVFNNEEGTHDWVLDEFNAKTPRVSAGQSAEVEFTAGKAGTFEYYCSVGNHRARGMKGSLIVE